jgi:hypothetical protein
MSWSHSSPFIKINDNNAPTNFFFLVMNDLNALGATKLGNDLLKLISQRSKGIGTRAGKDVVIQYLSAEHVTIGNITTTPLKYIVEETGAASGDTTQDSRREPKQGSIVSMPGRGANTVVGYSPLPADARWYRFATGGVETPTWLALAHELIHTLHIITGETKITNPNDYACVLEEEAYTIGLGIYANTRISENAIRREVKLPVRTYYTQVGDCDNLTSKLKDGPARGTLGGNMNPALELKYLRKSW